MWRRYSCRSVMCTDLGEGAAGPQTRLFLTAGGSSRTHCLLVTLLVLQLGGQSRHLFHPAEGRKKPRRVVASFSLQVAHGAVRAAVQVVLTAHSLAGTQDIRMDEYHYRCILMLGGLSL